MLINSQQAAEILERELGVKPDSMLKDKQYVLMPSEWYFKSPRWFRGFEYLEYVTDGNDCDDWQRTGREEFQRRFRKMKEVKQGGLPVFELKVLTVANVCHAIMAIILPGRRVMLIERVADRIVQVPEVREIYNVYPA